MAIFTALAATFFLVGAGMGDYFLGVLHVSAENRVVAVALYWVSLLGTVFSLLSLPFQSLLVSGGRQDLLAVAQLLPQCLQLLVIWGLSHLSLDPMMSLAWVTGGAAGLGAIMPCLLARKYMQQAKLVRVPGFWREARAFFDFAAWNFAGRLNWILRNAGTTVVLASQFGNVAVAGFSVANNAVVSLLQFTFASMGVVQVEMTAAEVRGQFAKAKMLASRLSLGYSLIGVGLVFGAWAYGNEMLTLWLKNPPVGASLFLGYAALYQTIAFLSIGEAMIMEARGKIRGVTLIVAIPQLLVFGIGAILVLQNRGSLHLLPQLFVLAAIFTSVFARPLYLARIGVVDITFWLRSVVAPVLVAILLCAGVGCSLRWLFQGQAHGWEIVAVLTAWAIILGSIAYLRMPELFVMPSRLKGIFGKQA